MQMMMPTTSMHVSKSPSLNQPFPVLLGFAALWIAG